MSDEKPLKILSKEAVEESCGRNLPLWLRCVQWIGKVKTRWRGARPETRTMSGSKSLKKEDRGWAKQMDASVVKQARHGE